MAENNQETWQNVTDGTVWYWRIDARGDRKDVIVGPGAKFTINREDRILNMDEAANKDLDNFSNGTLAPVRLLDGTEDAKEFASNPNLLSEDDLKGLFKAHWKTFESRVATITNPGTLNRLMAVAEEVDATMRQVKLIKARIDEVDPARFVEVTSTPMKQQATTGFAASGQSSRGGVTPR